jgi:putative oxidoreductase
MASLGLLVLRLTLSVVLVAHGAHQLFGMFGNPGIGAGGLTNTAASYSRLGLEPGFALAVLSGIIQFLGGALLGAGLLTRWAALAIIGYLCIAIWKDQFRWGFFLNWVSEPTRGHGVEFSVLIIGALAALALSGAGEWSLDGRRATTAATRAAGRARLRRG